MDDDAPIDSRHVAARIAGLVSRQGKFGMSLHGSARTKWWECHTHRTTLRPPKIPEVL